MHAFKTICLFAVVAFLCGKASAQPASEYIKERNPWPVVIRGDTLEIPFWGGINDPKPSLVDFDGDGLLDLMIGEGRGKVAYFQNTGSAFSPVWTPVSERLGGVDVGQWSRFYDIDADGDLDLFCDSRFGTARFYRNESVGSAIVFVHIDSIFGGFNSGFKNTPDFADIDNDGDLDFFFGNGGGWLEFYRNDGTPQADSFNFVTSFYDSVLAFPGQGRVSESQHGASVIHFTDLDGDGDIDLLFGDIFNPNMYFFENFGSPDSSSLTFRTEQFLPISTFGFNHPATGDIDNDGLPELVVGAANNRLNDTRNLILLDQVAIFKTSGVESQPPIYQVVTYDRKS